MRKDDEKPSKIVSFSELRNRKKQPPKEEIVEEEEVPSVTNILNKAVEADLEDVIVIGVNKDKSLHMSCSDLDPVTFLGLMSLGQMILTNPTVSSDED